MRSSLQEPGEAEQSRPDRAVQRVFGKQIDLDGAKVAGSDERPPASSGTSVVAESNVALLTAYAASYGLQVSLFGRSFEEERCTT